MTHTERDVSSYNQGDDAEDVEERVALAGGAIIAHLSIRAPVSTALDDLVTLQRVPERINIGKNHLFSTILKCTYGCQ